MKIKKFLSLLALLSILITSVPNSSFANEPTVISRAHTDESKFTFDKSTNTITKFTGDETEVTIPETIGGVPVKAIGKQAFLKKNVSSVVLNEGLETIGNGAFAGVSTLTKIKFPSSLKKIDDMAFMKTSLTEIQLNEGLESIGKRAFSNCTSLKTINLPNSLTKISDLAFEKCSISNDIKIGENLGHVGHRVFSGNNGDINIYLEKVGNKLYLHDELFLNNQNSLEIPQDREIMLFTRAFCDKSCSATEKITLDCGSVEISENETKENVIKLLNEKIKLTSGFAKIGKASDGSQDEYFETNIDWDIKDGLTNGAVISGKFKNFDDASYTTAKQNKEVIETVLARFDIKVEIKINNKNFDSTDFTYQEVESKVISSRKYFGISGFTKKGLEKLKTNKDLVIPATVSVEENGKTVEKRVEGICPKAFAEKGLNSVKINVSEGYNEYMIDTGAFQKNNLTEFEIPMGIKFIESYSFKENKIKKLDIPQTVLKVGNESFADNEIEKLVVSDGVSGFQFDSFSFSNNKIKEVDLPFSIFKLLQNVFYKNTGNADGKVILYTRNKKHLETSTYINPHSEHHKFILVGENVERNKLQKLLEIVKGLDKSDYEVNSFASLEKVYTDAKAIMLNHDSTQEMVDDITTKLSKAIEDLVPNGANKKALIKNITRLSNLNPLLYTEDSYNKFLEELQKAKNVAEDKTVKQDEIDKALADLLMAEGKLVLSENAKYNYTDFVYEGTKILGFTELGKEKFEYNKDLVIPKTNKDGEAITEIGDKAFEYTGEYVYTTDTGESVNGLLSVEIPETVKKIGKNAFQKHRLKEVNLPKGLEEIGDSAFNGNVLNSIEIPDSVEKMGVGVFSLNKITHAKLSKNMKTIPNGIFSRNINLESIEIPNGVEVIGEGAFTGCPLKSLKIPNTVKEIKRYAFLSHRIETLEIPSSVETIEDQAFASNKKFRYLKNLILNEGLKKIGKDAFKSGIIQEVEIPSSLESLDKNAFNDNMDSEKNIIKVKVYTYNKEHLTKFEESKFHKIVLKEVILDEIKAEIEKANKVKETEKYTYSSEEIKTEFEKALANGVEALKNPLSQRNVDNLAKTLKEKVESLNGVKPVDHVTPIISKPELKDFIENDAKDSKIQGEKIKEIINENIVLKIDSIEKEEIKTIKTLENKDVDVFDIYLKNIVTDKVVKLPNGNYKITLPKRVDRKVLAVYYLDDSKNIINHEFTQDDTNNTLTFETTHLSKFVIEYKVVQESGDNNSNNTTENITTDNTSGTADNTNNSTTTESSNGSQKLVKTNISSSSLLVTALFGFGLVVVSKKKR